MTTLILTDVRLSYPALFEAKPYKDGSNPRYGATLLVSKEDKDTIGRIEAAIKQVATEKWGKDADKIMKAINADLKARCWVDGDLKNKPDYMQLAAYRSAAKGKPSVVNRSRQPLTATDGVPYAGCYVNAKIQIWAQDNATGKGMRAELLAVQFLRDGEAFGGGSPATADGLPEMEDELSALT